MMMMVGVDPVPDRNATSPAATAWGLEEPLSRGRISLIQPLFAASRLFFSALRKRHVKHVMNVSVLSAEAEIRTVHNFHIVFCSVDVVCYFYFIVCLKIL